MKLQRLVAASALICGRATAQLSDLWVFRYIWDNLEQQEVLASIVDETLKKAQADGTDHPRARNANAPDAEILARESGQSAHDPAKLIAPMLARFMATDRAFTRARRLSPGATALRG